MEVTFKIPDGVIWVHWHQRAGAWTDGRWTTTDLPGMRTGPFGRWHATLGDGYSGVS